MTVVEQDGIKVALLEVIPLEISDEPKHYLVSFKLIDGDKHLPPIFKIVSDRDDLREVLKKEIEVYLEIRQFMNEVFGDVTPV